MNQDPAKAAKARALVASLLFVEAAVIAGLGLWLLVMSFTHENVEIYPLLGVLLFAVAWVQPGLQPLQLAIAVASTTEDLQRF